MQADYVEEHTTSTHATEMLESETAQRLKLERELKDVHVSTNHNIRLRKILTDIVRQAMTEMERTFQRLCCF